MVIVVTERADLWITARFFDNPVRISVWVCNLLIVAPHKTRSQLVAYNL